jgi:hypothetical protein
MDKSKELTDSVTLDDLSVATFCPVWSMIRGNVTVEVRYNITQ